MSNRCTRRSFLAGLAAAPLLARAQEAARPNILIILPDQVPAHELGIYGGRNVPTPNMDRLAAQGTALTNAISTCPLCAPFRGMMLSGRYPTHNGMLINWLESNPHDPSLALSLGAAGYRTGYIGKWHLNAGKMKRDGLFMSAETRELEAAGDYAHRPKAELEYVHAHPEPEYVPPGAARRGFEYWAAYNFHAAFTHAYYYRDTSERLFMPRYETASEADMGIEFMRQSAASSQPFFLVVSMHPPHQPWSLSSLAPGSLARVRPELLRRPNVFPKDASSPHGDIRCYYAMLGSVDDAVGRLTDYLDASGLAANTLVIMTSDHGEMMGSHGKWEKMAPYEEAIRVPLIYRWPGHVGAGKRLDILFTPMDHLPTLLSLAGASAPSGTDGMDLSGALLGRPAAERDGALIANYSSHWDYFHSEWPWPEWRGVRTKQHTYVKWFSGREELFDNQADPYQMKDLAGSDLQATARLRKRLGDLLHEAHDDFLAGPAYASWYDNERNIIRTGLGAA
ncbi:MAG: sulfatase [Terriglobia bacterium]|jgi:arylsulfatase A-like enzyme